MPKEKIAKESRNSKKKVLLKNKKNKLQEININVKKIKELFKKRIINKVAKETGFLKRKRKLHAYDFFLALTFGALKGSTLTLSALKENLTENMTRVAINKRFTAESYNFLMKIYSNFFKVLNDDAKKIDVATINKFSAIKIIDSSSWKIPKAFSTVFKGYNGAGCKIQMMIDYATGLIQLLDITKESFNDQSYSKMMKDQIHKGELLIFDLGYSIPIFLKTIAEQCAFFLSRFNYHAMRLYVKKNGIFYDVDILKVLKKRNFINQL